MDSLEAAWTSGLNHYGEFWFVTMGTFLLHELFYFGSYLPFWLADYVPALQRYKIQADKPNTKEAEIVCLKRLLFNHFCIELPLIGFVHFVLPYTRISVTGPFPTWSNVVLVCIASFVVEDFYFYWVHRYLHHPSIYGLVHKIHHDHAAPFGMTAEYAHPVETIFLGIGTVLGPFLFADHLFTMWIWLFVRVWQTVEVHSGYDFPWSLNNWVPFWGGAKFHDWHHEKFKGNYSSTFTWCDRMFGTDTAYRHAYTSGKRA